MKDKDLSNLIINEFIANSDNPRNIDVDNTQLERLGKPIDMVIDLDTASQIVRKYLEIYH